MCLAVPSCAVTHIRQRLVMYVIVITANDLALLFLYTFNLKLTECHTKFKVHLYIAYHSGVKMTSIYVIISFM